MGTKRAALRGALVLLVVVIASAFVPAVRSAFLVFVGQALVADDPLVAADVIAIAPDAEEAGVLEAADLVVRGVSSRVAVIVRPLTPISGHFRRRGVDYADPGERYLGLLQALHVEHAEIVRMQHGGTEAFGEFLPEWSRRRGFASVLVVTQTDHSRRVKRVLRRNSPGEYPRITVRRARYSAFTPAHWWKDRSTVRTGLVELQKLALDVALHPLTW